MSTSEGFTGASADAIELLTSDHREVDQLFRQLDAAHPDTKVAPTIAEQIVQELSVHAVVEEELVYPELRNLPGGEPLTEQSINEHQELKDLLASVDGKPLDEPQVRQTFTKIEAAVKDHVQEEEGQVFPLLRTHLGQERIQQLGDALAKAKKAAPTHPHPHAPNTPPGNVIAGLAATVVDKVRDLARSAMRQD